MRHRFSQVDVFSAEPFRGNPVAVVHGADDIDEADMASFARWTNLSETTFLLSPTTDEADYRLRIFTPGGELPFAGHPTLGSARAWLEAGGTPRSSTGLVQECAAGLIQLRSTDGELSFAAPPLVRSGSVDPADIRQIQQALDLPDEAVLDAAWVDNGPGWIGLLLDSPDTVLALRPDLPALGDLKVGVLARYPDGGPADVEVRAFVPSLGVGEDPVTGSLNAGLALWLIGNGTLPPSYTAAQGAALGRRGRRSITSADGQVWIGGDAVCTITGEVTFAG